MEALNRPKFMNGSRATGCAKAARRLKDRTRLSCVLRGHLAPQSARKVRFSPGLDSIMGEPVEMRWMTPKPYDVDRVDDMLDTTERADIADL